MEIAIVRPDVCGLAWLNVICNVYMFGWNCPELASVHGMAKDLNAAITRKLLRDSSRSDVADIVMAEMLPEGAEFHDGLVAAFRCPASESLRTVLGKIANQFVWPTAELAAAVNGFLYSDPSVLKPRLSVYKWLSMSLEDLENKLDNFGLCAAALKEVDGSFVRQLAIASAVLESRKDVLSTTLRTLKKTRRVAA